MNLHTHDDFDQDEVVERYVRELLGSDARRAFEEHVLDCDTCFERLQDMQRFVSGVRYAARAGLLDASAQGAGWWWRMAPAFALAASVILVAASAAWIWNQRASMDALTRQQQTLVEQLASARGEMMLTARKTPPPQAGQLPLAILDASRSAAGANEVTIPASADRFALWIQVDPEPDPQPADVQIFDSQARLVAALSGLHENRYGALAIALPAASFPAGIYRVRVFRAGHVLTREYLVKISIA